MAISDDGDATQLTAALPAGVSWLAESYDRIVIAAPVQLFDHVLEYRDGHLIELDPTPAYTPEVGPDGSIAYQRQAGKGGSRTELAIYRRRRIDEVKRVTYNAPVIGWGGRHRVAVLSGQDHRKERILVVDSRTGRTVMVLHAPDAMHGLWRPGAPIAYDTGEPRSGGTILYPDSGRRRRVPHGWHPLAWSPRDPYRLLVTDGHHLGLLDPARPGNVRRLAGHSTQPIRTAAWLLRCPKPSPRPATAADIVAPHNREAPDPRR